MVPEVVFLLAEERIHIAVQGTMLLLRHFSQRLIRIASHELRIGMMELCGNPRLVFNGCFFCDGLSTEAVRERDDRRQAGDLAGGVPT